MILKKYKNYEIKQLESDEYEDYVLWQSKESGNDRCSNLVFRDLLTYKNKTGFILDLDATIIDVGCRGNATVVKGFTEQGYANCYGIDIGYDAEENWKLLPQNIQAKLKRNDAQNGLHFDYKYDFITCSHVLEHCPDPKKVVDIFYNALKDDGRIHLQIPLSTYDEYIEHHPHFAYWKDRDAFCEFLEDCNFKVEYSEYGTPDNRKPFDDLMVIIKKDIK
jgi:2-polyprenyl-3-methyl-5-hydroxy-6-metoxy-1,4-benzoquinol methylase